MRVTDLTKRAGIPWGGVRRLAVCATAALLVLVAVPAPAGASPAPSVTATPSTGLVDGQSVTVAGSGFAPGARVGIEECPLDHAPFGCSGIEFTRTADANGAFSSSITVFTRFQDVGPLVDCLTVSGGCTLEVNRFTEDVVVPISFASGQPPARSVTATPHTGLLDHEVITARGAHFPGGQKLLLAECFAPSNPPYVRSVCGPSVEVTTGRTGTFHTGFRVNRFTPVPGPPGRTDCADPAARCVLQANVADNPFLFAQTPLAFLPPAQQVSAAIVVNPNIGLDDGQSVTVMGSGFAPDEAVDVRECRDFYFGAHPTPSCPVGPVHVTTNHKGAFTASLVVRNQGNFGATSWGCRAACSVRATALLNPSGDDTRAPITFALYGPSGPGPLVVSPTTGLVDGQKVAVSETGFAFGASFDVFECRTKNMSASACRVIDSAQYGVFADAQGNFTGQFTVVAQLQVVGPSGLVTVNCTARAKTCSIVVGDAADLAHARAVPVSFKRLPGTSP